MNVLVTGGLGYIGSHTVVALIESGFSVIIADNLSNSKIDRLYTLEKMTNRKIPFYKIDVANSDQVEMVFKNHKIQGVIHFAGYKAVAESTIEPLKYYRNNLLTTITISEICNKFKVNKLVFSSSATVYGENKSPFKESMELLPTTNPYGESKVMCERILADLARSNECFEVSILRYFNPIGAHESGLIGDIPNGRPNNLMPYITQVAKGRLNHLLVFGDDYPTIDGTGVRDFIHIMDLAEGHVAALKGIKPGVSYYNLGTGIGTSVLQLIQTFERVNNTPIPYQITERRPGDLATCYADATKAKLELGWRAERTIEDMCADAWRFEQSCVTI